MTNNDNMKDMKLNKNYLLISPSTGLVYVGHTTQRLSQRHYQHKQSSNKCISKQITSFGDSKIILIESFPCDTEEEARKREQELIEEHKDRCVNCNRAYSDAEYRKNQQKEYREANADKIKEYYKANIDKVKAYYKANADKINASKKEYRDANSEKIKASKQAYYKANAEKIKAYNKAYREANAEKEKDRRKAYREANAEKIKAYKQAYYKAKSDKIKAERETILI